MQELMMTPSTVLVLGIIAVLAVLAVRRMFKRGLCDCGKSDGCGGHGDAGCAGCVGCSAHTMPGKKPTCCSASQAMVDKMDKTAMSCAGK